MAWNGVRHDRTDGLHGRPSPIWKVWDTFGLQDARMIGYWDKNSPVTMGHGNVLAAAYVKKGQTLVAIASWTPEDVKCKLTIDWNALGIDRMMAKISAPEVKDIQPFAELQPNDTLPIAPGRGWLLIIVSNQPT